MVKEFRKSIKKLASNRQIIIESKDLIFESQNKSIEKLNECLSKLPFQLVFKLKWTDGTNIDIKFIKIKCENKNLQKLFNEFCDFGYHFEHPDYRQLIYTKDEFVQYQNEVNQLCNQIYQFEQETGKNVW